MGDRPCVGPRGRGRLGRGGQDVPRGDAALGHGGGGGWTTGRAGRGLRQRRPTGGAGQGTGRAVGGTGSGLGRRRRVVRNPATKVLTRRQAVDRYGPGRDFKLAFTNGCFDLLHPGHVDYLSQARQRADALVVGVNTDASVRRLAKGPDRPLVDERARAEVVAALESVDAVTLFDEDTPAALIAALLPDVLLKGGDYEPEEIVGRETVEAGGGEVVLIPFREGYSTTSLVARIRGEERGT
ncbi:MAG: D-glycero-beta-D-manno-heptose 1-phosphate adenylyltransferase [Gemmatimonadetes bacterium]|nr:D-glycero-beta-D-manno-heptose 1-phosphate adenylyltransferase [Gemmatimonadota bacterium]